LITSDYKFAEHCRRLKMSTPNIAPDRDMIEKQPELPPTAPHDPVQPDPSKPEPLPLPPDSPTPQSPVREPDPVQPVGDPTPQEPPRLAR
jgi:hypothetical protein